MVYDNSGVWTDDDIMGLHYEIASSSQAWLYGSTLGHEISSLTTNASRYSPSTGVTINADIVNPQAVTENNETLTLAFTHNGVAVGSNQTATVSLAPGQVQNYAVSWTPPTTNYQGYLIQATLTDVNGHVLDTAYTAVDVSSSWTKFPRYGFVTNRGQLHPDADNEPAELVPPGWHPVLRLGVETARAARRHGLVTRLQLGEHRQQHELPASIETLHQ